MTKSRQRVLKRAAPRPAPDRPSLEVATATYVDLARQHVAIGADRLEALVAARFGLDPADELIDRIDGEVSLDPYGPVTMLPPDVVVHAPALMAGAVLTHPISADEQGGGYLVVDTDLAGFLRVDDPHVGDEPLDLDGVDGHAVWIGPEDWLAEHPVGTLLAVQVDDGGDVALTVLDVPPPAPLGLVERLRGVYERELEEPGLPVAAENLLLGVRFADRGAFAEAVPPLEELAAAAGLERRGSEFAHAESVWEAGAEADRHWRLIDRLGVDGSATVALEALDLLAAGTAAGLRRALDLMGEPDLVVAVTEELLGDRDDPDLLAGFVALADRLVAVAGRSPRAAAARWMAAVAAERARRPHDAESHLRAACTETDGWPFVEDRLAWFEADRGDAVAAVGRWRAIGTPDDDPDVLAARPFAVATGPEPGRNEPCSCGSGRKYKQCHLGKPLGAPLPERVGWLWRKAVAYLERRGGAAEHSMFEHAAARAGEDGDIETGYADPLTVDTALHEGGWFAAFLDERGPLLPPDEALLGASWRLVDRTVYEVLDVRPGSGMDLRDLRTGDRLAVTERTASRSVTAGALLCARAVPDGGDGHQFVGGVLSVPPGRERGLLALLDEGDGLMLLEWAAARAAPPRMLSPDGVDLVACTARVRVGPDAADVLDMADEPAGTGWVRVDADDNVLATLQLDGDVLTVQTLSESRMDDVLADLAVELPEREILSDDRRPVQPGPFPAGEPLRLDPDTFDEVLDGFERRWCDEHVPALDGHTPREAAADPTRRADLVRLIDSFPEIDPSTGAFGLRPHRLRELLGLT